MKVYTKKGDGGETSLLGGVRVPKHHYRIEAYGTVDELNSHIGLLKSKKDADAYKDILTQVQDHLFTIGSHLAVAPDSDKVKVPPLDKEWIADLENAIDAMEATLSPLKSFVLPGGSEVAAQCHVARCVCRRAERRVAVLKTEESLDESIVPYLNRLSDYLFVLSRKLLADHGIEDEPWTSR